MHFFFQNSSSHSKASLLWRKITILSMFLVILDDDDFLSFHGIEIVLLIPTAIRRLEPS